MNDIIENAQAELISDLAIALQNILTQYGNVRAAENYPPGDSVSMANAREVLARVDEFNKI